MSKYLAVMALALEHGSKIVDTLELVYRTESGRKVVVPTCVFSGDSEEELGEQLFQTITMMMESLTHEKKKQMIKTWMTKLSEKIIE